MRLLLVETTQYRPASPLFLDAAENMVRDGALQLCFVDEMLAEETRLPLLGRAWRRVTGRSIWRSFFNREILRKAAELRPDVALIVKGAGVLPSVLREIKQRWGTKLINFSTDSPFNLATTSSSILRSLPEYDLHATPRTSTIDKLRRSGAKNVIYLPFGYHPTVHFPVASQYRADLTFIGAADHQRVSFLREVVSRLPDLTCHLYGLGWQEDERLSKLYRGFAIGPMFRQVVCGSTINLNLVREPNGDGHTMRTFELPACRGFVLASRTAEHRALIPQLNEALFSSAAECVELVRLYLSTPIVREQAKERAHKCVIEGRNTYADRLQTLLTEATTCL